MRQALFLKDGQLALYPNPQTSYCVNEEGTAILRVTSDPLFVPIFEIEGTPEEIRASLHRMADELETHLPGGTTYLIVRTLPDNYLTKPTKYQRVGLVCTTHTLETDPVEIFAWQ